MADEPNADREPMDDELAVFIDSEGSYRILIPNKWQGEKMPEFAFLAVAAILRLARRQEVEFAQGIALWAKKSLKLSQEHTGRHGEVKH